MAKIICELREEISQALLESGTGGVGGLQTREWGFTDESGKQWAEFKTDGGAFRQFPSLQRLDDAAAAASSGAKLMGYFPTSPLTATTVQDAIDQLAGLGGGGGGGSGIAGSGTAKRIMRWLNSGTAENSAFSEPADGHLDCGALDVRIKAATSLATLTLETDSGDVIVKPNGVEVGRFDQFGLKMVAGAGIKFSPSTDILDDYKIGSFTATIVETFAATTGTVHYMKIGQIVHLFFPDMNGIYTAGPNLTGVTGIPAGLVPASFKRIQVLCLYNNVGGTFGSVVPAYLEWIGHWRILLLRPDNHAMQVPDSGDTYGFAACSASYTLD